MKKSLAGANENSRRQTPGTRVFTGHTRRKSAGSIPLTTTDSPNPKTWGGEARHCASADPDELFIVWDGQVQRRAPKEMDGSVEGIG